MCAGWPSRITQLGKCVSITPRPGSRALRWWRGRDLSNSAPRGRCAEGHHEAALVGRWRDKFRQPAAFTHGEARPGASSGNFPENCNRLHPFRETKVIGRKRL